MDSMKSFITASLEDEKKRRPFGKYEGILSRRPSFFFVMQNGARISDQLCNPGDTYKNLLDFIPGGIIHNTGGRKIKDSLKLPYCILRGFSVNAIGRDGRQGRIGTGDGIELFLNLPDFIAGRTDVQRSTRPGSWNPGNFFGSVDIHVVSVEIPKDFNGSIALVSKIFGTPLSHPRSNNIQTEKTTKIKGFRPFS